MDEKEELQQPTENTAENKAEETPQKPQKPMEEPLDTETTFADMNVEGFHWYNPRKKKGKSQKISVTRKEYWAMVRGAFAAYLPMFLCIVSAFAIVVLLAYLWLKP